MRLCDNLQPIYITACLHWHTLLHSSGYMAADSRVQTSHREPEQAECRRNEGLLEQKLAGLTLPCWVRWCSWLVPCLYARSIRLSRPCRSAQHGNPPAGCKRPSPPGGDAHRRMFSTTQDPDRRVNLQGCVMRCEEDEDTDGCPCFFSFFGSTEEERDQKKDGRNITLTSPPSRRFLTRPHCVLLPLHLSLSGPHQLRTRLLLWLFFAVERTLRVTQTSTQQSISSRLSPPLQQIKINSSSSIMVRWVTHELPHRIFFFLLRFIFGSLVLPHKPPMSTLQNDVMSPPFCPCKAHESTNIWTTARGWKQHFI